MKTQNASDAENEGYMAAQHGVGMTENPYNRPPKMDQWLKGYQKGSKMKNSAFQSGADRATQTINQKAEAVGVKVGNESPGKAGMNAAAEDVQFDKAGITADSEGDGKYSLLQRGQVKKKGLTSSEWRTEARKLL